MYQHLHELSNVLGKLLAQVLGQLILGHPCEICHTLTGLDLAREYLRLGFKLGLGGAPTWPATSAPASSSP